MEPLFRKYFHSTLSPREFDNFFRILKNKSNDETIRREMSDMWKKSENEADGQINQSLLSRIKSVIDSEQRTAFVKKLRIYSVGLRVAAVLIIGLTITSVLLYNSSRVSPEFALNQKVEVPLGARTNLCLPDGSQVWLNSGSKIEFADNFSETREVQLSGEAYFDVVKSTVPFEVHTNYASIKVLGTAFNVDAYPQEGFSTTLERGVIEVSDSHNETQILKPGEQITIVQDKMQKVNVDTEIYTSWRTGKLIFKREPLPTMIKSLERWYNVKIEFDEKQFRGLWFSGTIEGESINEVMDMICKSAPLTYSYNSQTRIVQIK